MLCELYWSCVTSCKTGATLIPIRKAATRCTSSATTRILTDPVTRAFHLVSPWPAPRSVTGLAPGGDLIFTLPCIIMFIENHQGNTWRCIHDSTARDYTDPPPVLAVLNPCRCPWAVHRPRIFRSWDLARQAPTIGTYTPINRMAATVQNL
jgi:hypothetical protein